MVSFKASELILNPDGSVYHLNLRPEHIADTIITVGDPDRVGAVSKYFDKVEHKIQKREFVTHTGWIGKKRLSVISTGIGTDNIDIVMNELDALVNIDLENRVEKETHKSLEFIRVGTSGCLQADIPIDSFLVTDYAIGLEGLMLFYQRNINADEAAIEQGIKAHIKAQNFDFVLPIYAERGTPSFKELFSGDGWYHGMTMTAPGFYAPQMRQLRAKRSIEGMFDAVDGFRYQDLKITNFEMETAAIYGFANLLGHKAVSLSALIANRKLGVFSANPQKTVERLIESTLELLV